MKKTKVCNKCQSRKPIKQFYRNSASSDGLKNACKSCTYTKIKKKTCHICKETKKSTEFYTKTSRCKACDKIASTITAEKDITKLAGLLVATEIHMSRIKICDVCEKRKDIEDFRLARSNIDHLKTTCKRCESINNAQDLNDSVLALHAGVALREELFHDIFEQLKHNKEVS